MASIINKRQQARNERTLQELISSIPGNNVCVDCQAKNPGWASWSLGIFLCMRCAALHRKLGTHISKVKSLSMDTWSNEQVENMKKVGNIASNRTYNPRNIKPNLTTDPDEIDIAMEKFIREKYQRLTLSKDLSPRSASKSNTGSSSSFEDRPPPVPSKNTPTFTPALRSASSSYPTANADRPLPPIRDSSMAAQAGYEDKLARLRDMGFLNDKKNLTLLKGLSGNVDKTVEALVRLGEGDNSVRINTSARTPVSLPPRTDSRAAPINGAAAHNLTSNPEIPLRGQSLGSAITSATNSNPAPITQNKSYNPFEMQNQPSRPLLQLQPQPQPLVQPIASIDTSFQNLNLSQPPPLMTSNTGSWQAQNQHNPFLKTFTPPLSPSPYQNGGSTTYAGFAPDQVPQRSFTDPNASLNPFLKSSRSQSFSPSNPFNQTLQVSGHWADADPSQINNIPMPPVPPWAQTHRSASQPQLQQPQLSSPVWPPQNGASPVTHYPLQINTLASHSNLSQPPFQHQQVFAESPYQSPGIHTPLSAGQQTPKEFPFSSLPTQFQSQSPLQHQQSGLQASNQVNLAQPQFHQLQQHIAPQTTGQVPGASPRLDKNSILALYGQSHAAPATNGLHQPATAENVNHASVGQTQPQSTNGHRDVSSQNPFARLVSGNNSIGNHVRDESKDFSSLALNSNANGGRHSPDAFQGLSARFR